jgi:hypothetical protein
MEVQRPCYVPHIALSQLSAPYLHPHWKSRCDPSLSPLDAATEPGGYVDYATLRFPMRIHQSVFRGPIRPEGGLAQSYLRCLALKTWGLLLSSHVRSISRDSCEVHSMYGNIPKGRATAFLCASRWFSGWNERRDMITYKSIRKLLGQLWLIDFAYH